MNPNWSELDINAELILFNGILDYEFYPNRTQIDIWKSEKFKIPKRTYTIPNLSH